MQQKQPTFSISGERESGQDVRTQNVTAAISIANIVKSSLGPVGLDKMLVDDIGDVTITNDGATILKLLEVEHPAAKVLVELADLQDQEVGDGTTSVVLLAAELLSRANELVKRKIHPTSIISGFRLASREAVKYITDEIQRNATTLGRKCLINVAKTSMSSKIIGSESDFFANICVDALLKVKTVNNKKEEKYPLKSINILKAHGKSAKETMFVDGFALNCTVASQAMPKKIHNAKIALLDFNLNKQKMGLGVQIVVTDPSKVEAIKQKEADMVKDRINMILKAGANVVLTTKGIDDLCLKYFVEAGAMAVRRVKKEDLRRISKSTGGTIILNLANLEGEESFDPSYLGYAGSVSQERIADDELIIIKDCKQTKTVSIILRGANSLMLEEMERSMHDALSIVKRTLESNAVVPGGGAVEAALSIYLEKFATTLGSREQLAIAEFAEALLVIPKTLAVNAGFDSTDLVAKLRSHHYLAHTDPNKKELIMSGLDLFNGKIVNNLEAGVLEPAVNKIKSIKFAVEAAITILRIDDLIKLNPKPKEQEEEEH
jgi:T-complex protein 1 subunit alpha